MPSSQGPFRRQTRILLWCGFGGLLLLMAVLGLSALSFLNRIQVQQEKIREDYVERDLTLEQVRADIYISGTYARDYLLDTSDELAATHKAAFFDARSRIEAAIPVYQRLVRPGEREAFAEFEREARAYLETVTPAMDWTADERRARGPAFVEKEVLPRRMLAVDLTDRMHQLSQKQLEAAGVEVSDLFSNFRTRLFLLLAFTLGTGLVLSGSALRRILALEREGDRRFQQILHAQQELKRLSSELLSAQENERRRISRELHDEVGQVLSAIMLGLGNLRAAIGNGDPAEALSQLQLVEDMTQRNASVVRNISLLLRPTMLDDLGLLPALKWLAREVSRTSGIHVEVVAETAPDDVPEDHRTCVFRVVQEAVHNAARHAGAKHIRICLQKASADGLRVSVQDDGKGFEPSGSMGLGILGMQERVLRLGGTFRVDSQPGRGTMIAFDLPVPAAQLTKPLRTA